MMKSILDQDLYTLTVGQAILECFPEAVGTFHFINRKGTKFDKKFMNHFEDSINAMANLRLLPEEKAFLQKECRYLKSQYINHLDNFRFDPNVVQMKLKDGDLDIAIPQLWSDLVHWEVPSLFGICDSYYKTIDTDWTSDNQRVRFEEKSKALQDNEVYFSDFGTRRRRNYETQDLVVSIAKNNPYFLGTSNVHLAHKHGVKPRGTMSHQWIMGTSALESLAHANKYALRYWNNVYHGDLGIALPDTFGTKAFFEDFDKELARLFDGVRHDSGDPFEFARKVVDHYSKLFIDPSSKIIVFSDALNVGKAIKLKKYCNELGIKSSAGIGTEFTNSYTKLDGVTSSPALNIVMKLRSIARNASSRQIQVVKLSDELGKNTGEEEALRVAMWTFFGKSLYDNN